ncbi:unnamed protein product [Durusdinium trenchii]|uniref:Uncharacterized protein n=1 Tax=Durusdinium trenchii TaxID=1381693 RepID=A0ABP0I092_9DINO
MEVAPVLGPKNPADLDAKRLSHKRLVSLMRMIGFYDMDNDHLLTDDTILREEARQLNQSAVRALNALSLLSGMALQGCQDGGQCEDGNGSSNSFMWETWRITLFQMGIAILGIIGMILYKKFIRRGQLAEETFHEALLEEQSRREEVPQLHREPHEPEEHGLPHRYPQDEEPYPHHYDDMEVDEEPFNVFGVNAASRPRPTSAQTLHGDEELAEEDNLTEDDNYSMSVDAEQILDFGEHEDDFINLTEEEYDSYRTRLLVEVRGVEQYLMELNRKVRREMEDLDPRNVFYGDIRSQMISTATSITTHLVTVMQAWIKPLTQKATQQSPTDGQATTLHQAVRNTPWRSLLLERVVQLMEADDAAERCAAAELFH